MAARKKRQLTTHQGHQARSEVGIKLLSCDSPSAAAAQVDLSLKYASSSERYALCLSGDEAHLCRSAHQGAL